MVFFPLDTQIKKGKRLERKPEMYAVPHGGNDISVFCMEDIHVVKVPLLLQIGFHLFCTQWLLFFSGIVQVDNFPELFSLFFLQLCHRFFQCLFFPAHGFQLFFRFL